MIKRIMLVIMLAVFSTIITTAQEGSPSGDGLSGEERALLDRLSQAAERFESYTSYNNVYEVVDNEVTLISMDSGTFDLQETRILEADETVLLGDNPNGSAIVSAIVERNEAQVFSTYTIDGELRYVDGVLYLNVAYAELQIDLPALPEGWVTVEDIDAFIAENPTLDILDLHGFVDQFASVETETDIEDPQRSRLQLVSDLGEFASAVTLDRSEINGEAVDVITVFFGWQGLSQILMQEDSEFDLNDPLALLFAEQLSELDDLLSLLIAVNDNGDIVGIATGFRVELIDVEMSLIADNVEPGTLYNLVLDNFEVNTITQINADFEPATAP